MPVAGQTPVRTHWEDSDSVSFEKIGSPYVDPNDSTKLVQDVKAHGVGTVTCVMDGGGSVPNTGFKGYVRATCGGTITGWSIVADQAGRAQFTVKKASDAGFPTTSSIVASAPPTLGSGSPVTNAQKATSTTLTGWTVDFNAGDVFEFQLDSVTTCEWLTLELKITKA